MNYAQNTGVTVDRSKAELERTLKKYGADRIVYNWDATGGDVVVFRIEERYVRLVIPLPSVQSFTTTDQGRSRKQSVAESLRDQEYRRLWRVLIISVKAKFETIAAGLFGFDEEFLGQIMIDKDHTIGDAILPNVQMIVEGKYRLLPEGKANETHS